MSVKKEGFLEVKSFRGRAAVVFILCLVTLVVMITAVGCGGSSTDSYKAQWKTTMTDFYNKLNADDAKAQQLSNKNDQAGVIAFVNQRIAGINTTIEQVMKFNTPASINRLQIETLYFLLALTDQLEAQNEFNKATVSGQPTTDLKTKVENAQRRVLAIGQELSVEQVSQNITLNLKSSSAPQPSSSPASSTGSQPK